MDQQTINEPSLDSYVLVDIEKVIKADWNYKEEDEFMSAQLINNLKDNGQLENIIIRELEGGMFEVVNGNHRLDAAHSIGWKKIIACNMGVIDQDEAKKIAVMTNETRFASNPVKLGEIMSHLYKKYSGDVLAQFMPYKKDELENFAKLTSFDWSEAVSNVAKDAQAPAQEVKQMSATEISNGNLFVNETPQFEYVKMSKEVWAVLKEQLERVNKQLSLIGMINEDDLPNASFEMAYQCVNQMLASLTDEELAQYLK